MKNPLHKLVAEYPNNKIEFQWKNDGQLTHLVVDGSRLAIKGMSRSIFSAIQKDDASLDEELYRILKSLTDALIKANAKMAPPAPTQEPTPTNPQG